jgi:hypothetical protein
MGSVAKGLRFGVPAATQSDGGAATKAKGLSFLVDDFKIAFDLNGAIVSHTNFGACHRGSSLESPLLFCGFVVQRRP